MKKSELADIFLPQCDGSEIYGYLFFSIGGSGFLFKS